MAITDSVPPVCEYGYTWEQLEEEVFTAKGYDMFTDWMFGQTQSICTGVNYNHYTEEYEPSACADDPHGGPIVYAWDLQRFIDIKLHGAPDVWD